ncbi:MAG: hypothetical protein JWM52_844 [Candidatus Saccharibacteria bacterium]|nr:hypothetical protein [Candidatus Saccharibacteria bacterium]
MTYIPPNPNGSATSANSAPVVIASDQAAISAKIANGTNVASVSPFGSLSTSIDPAFLFLDTFDGATIDVTNRWTSGGTVAPTQNGAILVNPTTTASATSALVSQPTFQATANSSLGIFIQLEATTIALGNYRFWGYGTAPAGVGTAAAPIQDGIGFEVDTSGVLRASVYASGTRTFTQTLTVPLDGLTHLYVVTINTGTSLFYRDTFASPIALSQLVPNTQTLPFRIVSLNSASVTGTPALIGTQAGVAEFAHQAQGISDGTYYWRKATVSATGAVSVGMTAPSIISTVNSTTANLAGAAVFTGTSEDVSGYGAVQISIFSSHASATDGLSLQQSPDGTNWDITDTYTISATTSKVISLPAASQYYRLVYTNGATLTTSLRIKSVFHVIAPNPSSQRPSDGYTNESDMLQSTALSSVFNGTSWDRQRGLSTPTTTGDTGAKTATGNGATQTNVGNKGVQIFIDLVAVSGTTPTCVFKLQGSVDGGTLWYDIPGAATASLTTLTDVGITVYPGLTVLAGTITTGTTAVASNIIPRNWRVVWTIGGTTPSFNITAITYNYLQN